MSSDEVKMALTQMAFVIESTLLNSLESSMTEQPSENTRNWCKQVSLSVMSDLSEAGWSFSLSTGHHDV